MSPTGSVAAGTILEALTSTVLRDVFGVNANVHRHPDGVARFRYHADPLAAPDV